MSDAIRLRFWQGEPLPAGIGPLRQAAQAKGFRHLDSLPEDCLGAKPLFRPRPARLCLAWRGEELAGIGGLTRDPYDPAPTRLRMRRFYVAPAHRRCGIAEAIASALLETLPDTITSLTLHAAPGSEAFWAALGFRPVIHPSRTHERGR